MKCIWTPTTAASSTLENPSTPPSTDGPNTGYVTGPGNQATGEHFTIKYHDMNDVVDFLVLRQTFNSYKGNNQLPLAQKYIQHKLTP